MMEEIVLPCHNVVCFLPSNVFDYSCMYSFSNAFSQILFTDRVFYNLPYPHHYRESGEMCAMKEVTLFSNDAKSKESAKQLGQEIALLSRLKHPNIVQYYGSE